MAAEGYRELGTAYDSPNSIFEVGNQGSLPEIHEDGVRDFIDPSVNLSHEASYGILGAYWQSQGFTPPQLSAIMKASSIDREEAQEPSEGNRLMVAPIGGYIEPSRQNGLWLPHEDSVLTRLVTATTPGQEVKGQPKELDGRITPANSYRLGFKSPNGEVVSRAKFGRALLRSGQAVKRNGVIWTINTDMDVSPNPSNTSNAQALKVFEEKVHASSTAEMHIAVKALHLIAGTEQPRINDPLDSEIINQAICRTEKRGLEPIYIAAVSWTPSLKDKDVALSLREARMRSNYVVR